MEGDALVLVNGGALDHLNALRVVWLPSVRIGLYQNDWTPHVGETLAHVVPAVFSGYNGLHNCYGWQAAVLFGNVAITQAGPNLWTHDGGPVACWVFGYYVVNQAGGLVWAQRKQGLPVPMDMAGSIYRVVPKYAVASRFTE